MPAMTAPDSTPDEFLDDMEEMRFHSAIFLGRILINRRRRRVGKQPFPWFDHGNSAR